MAASLWRDPQSRKQFRWLTEYLGDQMAVREPELERLGPAAWRVERDIELLSRYVPVEEIRRAYIVGEIRRKIGGRP